MILTVVVLATVVNQQLADTHSSSSRGRSSLPLVMNSPRHGASLPLMEMTLTGTTHESPPARRRELPLKLLKGAPMVETMQTIEDMVRLMSMEGSEVNEDPLMQELLQLANEITTSMTPTTKHTSLTSHPLTPYSLRPYSLRPYTMMHTSTTSSVTIRPTTMTYPTMISSTRWADATVMPNTSWVEAPMTITTSTTPDVPITATPIMAEAVREPPNMAYTTSNATATMFLERVKSALMASGIELILPLDCGRNPRNRTQVLGEPLPWVVALGSREDGRFHYRCTGVIITNFHILTDADCVASPHIVVQASRSGKVPDPMAEENYVVGRRIHPDIEDRDDLFTGINIGILELANPFIFNDYLQPVCLPGVFEELDPEARFLATIAGYNNITDGPRGRSASRYAKHEVLAEGAASCFIRVRTDPDFTSMLYSLLTKTHICLYINFETVGKSVVLMEDKKSGRVKLVGVGGFANARSTVPVAYTLVQPYRFWVELVLKKFLANTALPEI